MIRRVWHAECDDPLGCEAEVLAEADAAHGGAKDVRRTKEEFVGELRARGWLVSGGAMFCPDHWPKERAS